MFGGKTPKRVADETVQKICSKAQLENDLQGYPMFKALEYRTQVVNGINYFIKVQVDDDGSCIYLKLHASPGAEKVKLVGLEEGFSLSSQFL